MSPCSGPVRSARRTAFALAVGAVVVAGAAGCQPTEFDGSAPPVTGATNGASPQPVGTPAGPTTPARTTPSPTTAASATAVPPASGPPPTAPAGPDATSSAPTAAPTSTVQPPAPASDGRIRPGVVYAGPATHYGADGGGNCLFDPSSDPAMPVVAMNEADYENARACGAYIEVTGPGGTTVVKVTDRCPECGPGHLDLSRQAFDRIAGGVPGRVDVTWRLVSPADIGPVQYRIKEGSSPYWLAIQVLNHRNPIASLEVEVNGSWVALPREMWNYFVAPQGLGSGPYAVRITDILGERLVHTVDLAPNAVQTTTTQFAQW